MAFFRDLDELIEAGPVCLATIVATQGSTPREPGAKMVITASGELHGTIGGGHLEELVAADARQCIASGKPRVARYPLGASAGQCCGGVVEVFLEPLGVGPVLLLFGVGHVGQALTRALEGTRFRVHAIDERSEWIDAPRLPAGVVRHRAPWDEAIDALPWDAERTFVCVMTHRHDVDEAIVGAALRKPVRFVGLIGSRTKWAKLRARLEARGLGAAQLDRVRCPLGLPLGGGKAPAEVAISIAAELLRVAHEAMP